MTHRVKKHLNFNEGSSRRGLLDYNDDMIFSHVSKSEVCVNNFNNKMYLFTITDDAQILIFHVNVFKIPLVIQGTMKINVLTKSFKN